MGFGAGFEIRQELALNVRTANYSLRPIAGAF
jgi:hypothetical protein